MANANEPVPRGGRVLLCLAVWSGARQAREIRRRHQLAARDAAFPRPCCTPLGLAGKRHHAARPAKRPGRGLECRRASTQRFQTREAACANLRRALREVRRRLTLVWGRFQPSAYHGTPFRSTPANCWTPYRESRGSPPHPARTTTGPANAAACHRPLPPPRRWCSGSRYRHSVQKTFWARCRAARFRPSHRGKSSTMNIRLVCTALRGVCWPSPPIAADQDPCRRRGSGGACLPCPYYQALNLQPRNPRQALPATGHIEVAAGSRRNAGRGRHAASGVRTLLSPARGRRRVIEGAGRAPLFLVRR